MAYSTDLREKIVRAYDNGLGSQRAIAELFGGTLLLICGRIQLNDAVD